LWNRPVRTFPQERGKTFSRQVRHETSPEHRSVHPSRREVSQLFDHVFKCLLSLSDTAVITLINALFNTSYPASSSLSRPSPETVETSLRRSLADTVFSINGDSFLIEAQIHNDRNMGARIFQYVMNQGRTGGSSGEDHVIRIKLPRARVIYWESTPATADRETIVFIFPGGKEYRYEAPSVKFSEYTVDMVEKAGLSLLLPFCVLKYRGAARKAKGEKERKELAIRLRGLVEELAAAAERSYGRKEMEKQDMANVLDFTKLLQKEIYKPYSEFEEAKMWEHIKVRDYNSLWKRLDEVTRERDETARQAEEEKRREREAVRKLLELGVSPEQLATAGLLKPAGE
jgi:hypothetical protein